MPGDVQVEGDRKIRFGKLQRRAKVGIDVGYAGTEIQAWKQTGELREREAQDDATFNEHARAIRPETGAAPLRIVGERDFDRPVVVRPRFPPVDGDVGFLRRVAEEAANL